MATRTAKEQGAGKAAPAKTKAATKTEGGGEGQEPRRAARRSRRPAAKATAAKATAKAAPAPEAPVRVEPADAGWIAARPAKPAPKAARPHGRRRASTAASPAGLRRRRKRPTREERAAAGKVQRQTVPVEALGAFEPADGAARPRRDPRAAGEGPAAVPAAGPPRAHAPERVRLLPRRSGRHGRRPRRRPAHRARGAAVRRRPPAQLRRLRLAGALAGLRRQRLRRDAARPVRVGRQAAHRQPRRRGPRERHRAARGSARSPSPARAPTATFMRRFAEDGHARRSGTRSSASTASSPASTTRCCAPTRRGRPPRRRAGTAPRRPPSSLPSRTARGRSPARRR